MEIELARLTAPQPFAIVHAGEYSPLLMEVIFNFALIHLSQELIHAAQVPLY